MIDVGYCYQRAGYATPGGVVIPMPESDRVYTGTSQMSEDELIDITKKYGTLLRHSDTEIPFSKFLLTQLNEGSWFQTYPRGLYIGDSDKEKVKRLVRENIPSDVQDRYWEINRELGATYVPKNEFQIGEVDTISREWSRVKSLEEKLTEIETESSETFLPRVPEEIRRSYELEYGAEADIYLNRDFNGTFRIY